MGIDSILLDGDIEVCCKEFAPVETCLLRWYSGPGLIPMGFTTTTNTSKYNNSYIQQFTIIIYNCFQRLYNEQFSISLVFCATPPPDPAANGWSDDTTHGPRDQADPVYDLLQ